MSEIQDLPPYLTSHTWDLGFYYLDQQPSIQMQMLRDAIDDLRSPYRDLLVLRYQQGYTMAELAEYLDASDHLTRSALREAERLVREKIKEKIRNFKKMQKLSLKNRR